MSRIDDSKVNLTTTTLTFDGQPVSAVPGESIAAALTAAGILGIRRDGRGKSRGMLCGMGACFECHVAVGQGPARRACLTPVVPDMQVRSLAYRESVTETPAEPASSQPARRESLVCDVIVIGAGPAGLSVAVRLAEAGRNVVVLDERHAPGGQYFKQKIAAARDGGKSDRQYRQGAERIARLRRSSATYFGGATVWGAFRELNGRITVCATQTDSGDPATADETTSLTAHARTLIVAVGAYESVPPFPGWTLPGVMATGAAQGLVRAYRVSPGKRVLIAGNGPLNLQLAAELVRSRVQVVAVAESAPNVFPSRVRSALAASFASPALIARGIQYRRILKKHGVPLLHGYHMQRATGEGAVCEATVAKIGDDGELCQAHTKRYDVDAVCLGYALQPSTELLASLGCRHHLGTDGRWVVETDEAGRTSVPGVYAIGDAAGLGGAQVAALEGELAACAILPATPSRRTLRRLRRQRRFQRHLWAMFQAPDVVTWCEDSIVCRCESVSARTLLQLIDSGVHEVNALKRLSRAGMGSCQGRYCGKTLLNMLKNRGRTANNSRSVERVDDIPCREINAVRPLNTRLPVKPVAIAAVAAEQPEWYGYREAANAAIRTTSATPQEVIADTDALIVGAGIVGAATALYLSREGVEVTLIDRGVANGEASGGNAGSLHLQLLPFDFDESATNVRSPAAVTLGLQKLGIGLWRELEAELKTDFELAITGGLMLAQSVSDLRFLQKKAALERRLGIDVDVLSAAETKDRLPLVAENTVGAAYCPGEGKINPLLATLPLLAEAQRRGAQLIETAAAAGIEPARHGYRVATDRGVIRCKRLVIAAGGWCGQIADMLGVSLPLKRAPQQMLVTQATDLRVPYLLSLAGRHLTMKQAANGNLLIGGGWPAEVDPETGRSVILRESVEGNLWAAMRVLPRLGSLQIVRSWASMGIMIDGAPIVGPLPGHPGVYIAAGANGYTMGPLFGRTLAELMTRQQSSVDISAFSVDRLS